MLAKAQGRRRKAGSEGSVEQSRDPMDKHRIRGLPGRTSGQVTAKSTVIKGRGGRFGGCAGKAFELTSGGPRPCPATRTERVARRVTAARKSAEGILAPGSQSDRSPGAKARTVERANRAGLSHWPSGRKSSSNWLSGRRRRVKPEASASEGPKPMRRASRSKARRPRPDRAWKRLSRGIISRKRWRA